MKIDLPLSFVSYNKDLFPDKSFFNAINVSPTTFYAKDILRVPRGYHLCQSFKIFYIIKSAKVLPMMPEES